MTKLLVCTCKHEYQQQKYGGQRVHNWSKKSDGWRCTVCKNTKKG